MTIAPARFKSPAIPAPQWLGIPKSWIREQARRDAIPNVRLGR
jgi:hypothetical protein